MHLIKQIQMAQTIVPLDVTGLFDVYFTSGFFPICPIHQSNPEQVAFNYHISFPATYFFFSSVQPLICHN